MNQFDMHYTIKKCTSSLPPHLLTPGVPSDADSSAASNKISGANSSKPNRPSLAKILLSLDGNAAKQQALSHILMALQIMYAR